MREHEDTQAIFREISDLKNMISNHIVETNTYRKERDKVIDAHSQSLWGDNGLEKKVDRIEQMEVGRKWTIRAITGALIVGISDKFFHIFK